MKSKYKTERKKSEEKPTGENVTIHTVKEKTSIVEREVKTEEKKCKRGRGQNILVPL